jgi:hypothetical protein
MSKESSGVKGERCLFLTNYFYPEVFRGNDIAFEMVKRGYEVTVITCIPNYPQGHFYEGYGLRSRRSRQWSKCHSCAGDSSWRR